jgi:hypothetical protein
MHDWGTYAHNAYHQTHGSLTRVVEFRFVTTQSVTIGLCQPPGGDRFWMT